MADPIPPSPPPSSPPTLPPAPVPSDWWRRYGPVIAWAFVTLMLSVLSAITGRQFAPVPPPQVVETQVEKVIEVDPGQPPHATGWTPDYDALAADARQSQFRTFASTPAGQVQQSELPKSVFGWKYVEKVTGRPPPLKDQNPTGACVGFGTTTSIERTEAAEIVARGGDSSEFAFFAEEVMYAGSKVQGARAIGASVSRFDGSAGVFVKAFFQAGYGMCPEQKVGNLDLTNYDAARAASWNLSGPPPAVLDVCRKYPIKDVVKVTNWQQAKQAMAQGYFPSVCANWKYAAKRDARGVAADITSRNPRDNWNHCMALDGYHVDADGKEYGHIENSWTDLPDQNGRRTGQAYHTGPVGWGEPTTAGFWATAESIDRALRQGDTYAFTGVTGFPARPKLNWFIRNDHAGPRRDRDPLARLALALATNPALEVQLAW